MGSYSSIQKEQCTDMPNHMKGFQKHYDKPRKPDKNVYTVWSFIYGAHEHTKYLGWY